VILKLFEEPTDEPSQLAGVPIGVRFAGCAVAWLVAFIPAFTAMISAYLLTRFLRSMNNPQSIPSSAMIVSQIGMFNQPLVIGLGVAALLSFVFAMALTINPRLRLASVGFPCSIAILIIAAGPAVLLWCAETHILDALDIKVGSQADVETTASTIALLMFCALLAGILATPASFVVPLVSLLRSPQLRSDALSPHRVMIWLFGSVLLLAFSGIYLFLG